MGLPVDCDSCRAILAAEDDRNAADAIEAKHPRCECEKCTIGDGSPGPVENSERLVRLISSPRDYDPDRRLLLEQPFYKVYSNGLSVCRSIATNSDVTDLAIEALTQKLDESPRRFIYVCEASAEEVRSIESDPDGRVFCIYDQTVSRRDASKTPVPTHATIFQRLPAAGTPDRKRRLRDLAGKLREKFLAGSRELVDFRDGILVTLNERADRGEFVAKS